MTLPRALAAAIFVVFCTESPFAVEATEGAPRHSVLDHVAEGFEPSLFAPGFAAFNFPGSHLGRDSIKYSFEAVVIPRFKVFRSPRALLLLDPAFVVRRLDNLPSEPVRTPGYKPGATLYLAPREDHGLADRYLAFSFWHHSNGEDGEFGDVGTDGGALNDVDGSFSLWGAAVATHWRRDIPFLPRDKALRVEWRFWKGEEMRKVYPAFAINLALKTSPFRHSGHGGFAGWSRLFWEAAWSPGPDNEFHESLKPEPFSFSATAAYTPDWTPTFLPFPVRLGDFWLFSRFYAGPDYYNINFNRPVRRIDFGVMALPGAP
jgi:hypothetical protein